MNKFKIPFNKPALVGNEIKYITEAVRGGHASGDGLFTKKCHSLLENALGVPKVLLTTSCTHALEMAAILLDIQPGDEVVVPSFTFLSFRTMTQLPHLLIRPRLDIPIRWN